MVHALQEASRVLAASGSLLDLRPLSSKPPIEVVTPGGAVQVGVLDDSQTPDDAAVDRAMRQAVEIGWFVSHGGDTQFHTEHYWDTVKEMAEFIETRRTKPKVHPSYADIEKTYEDLSAKTSESVRLRCRWLGLLAVYRKAAG